MTGSPRRAWRKNADTPAAAIALALHVAVLAAVLVRPLPDAETPEGLATELTVNVEETPAPLEPPPPTPVVDEPLPHEVVRPTAEARRVATAEPPAQPAEATSSATAIVTAPETPPEAPWAPSWTAPRGIDLGLDGGIAWQTVLRPERVVDPAEIPGRDRDPAHLRAALDESNVALGFGSGGPVLSAVDEVRLTVAEVRDGAATIEVTTDATGHVLRVRARDATSDEAKWNETARAIGDALKGRTLPVPPGARGVELQIRVEVAVRNPSGARSGRPIAPVADTEGVGIGFDVSDLGSRARSVVHRRVVAERRL